MNWDEIKEDFAVRYYLWAWEDFKREIEQGFPILRTFRSSEGQRSIVRGSSECVLDMMLEMTRDEQLFFAGALVKRFHGHALQATGEKMTKEEIEICKDYRARSLVPTESELAARDRYREGQKIIVAKRSMFRKATKVELKKLNMQITEDRGVLWRYQTRVGDWNIVTEIDTSHRDAQIIYHHNINVADRVETVTLPNGEQIDKFIQLASLVSLNSWLGISSTTKWCDLVDSDCPRVIQALSGLCSQFLGIVPKLLKGLSP
jgi:hypothetical protein